MTTQELNNDWLKTYKFYDHQNRQLSIYAKYLPLNKVLAIYILTLNSGGSKYPPEKFNKKKADEYFVDYVNHLAGGDEVSDARPIRYRIPSPPDKTRLNFIQFCEENFFRKQTLNLMIMSTGLTNRRKYITVDGYFNKTVDRIDNKSLKIKILNEKAMKKIDEEMLNQEQQENFGFNINEN